MWMNPETITLSERSQTQKATEYMIPFIRNVQNRQIHRHRKQITDCRGAWGGGGGVTAREGGVSFWADENVLEPDRGGGRMKL